MAFQDDYREVVDTIEAMLVFVLTNLQERKQYRHLLDAVKRVHPSARDFRIGLDRNGKIPRISFAEAKRILKEDIGFNTAPDKNFTYVSAHAHCKIEILKNALSNTSPLAMQKKPPSAATCTRP